MSEHSNQDSDSDRTALRDQIIGLGEHSLRKSYFPQLQRQIEELKEAKDQLERKAVELESMRLRAEESEANYRELFDKSSEAIVVHDLSSTRIFEVNQAFCELYGYSHEEALQLSIFQLSTLPSSVDVVQEVGERICMAMKSGVHHFEWLASRKDGSSFWAEVTLKSTTIRGAARILAVIRDISLRKQAEEALAQASRQLEDKVAIRTGELKKANEELAALLAHLQMTQARLVQTEKLAALGALVAGVSHELATPVGNSLMLAGTLDEIVQTFKRETEAGLRKSVFDRFLVDVTGGLDSLLRNLLRISDQVRNFKEIAADQASSRRRHFDLYDVVHGIEIAQRPVIARAHCTFYNEVPSGIEMDSYPGPLEQILVNVTSNAILHGFEARAGGEIRISAERRGEEKVVLIFADNGCGIPAENLPRIFDPFFTTKLGQGGNGLGLHIVYNIITGVLGGAIQVESSPDHGTRFVFELPLIAPVNAG